MSSRQRWKPIPPLAIRPGRAGRSSAEFRQGYQLNLYPFRPRPGRPRYGPPSCRAPAGGHRGGRGGELAGSMWPRPHRSPISQRPFGAYTTAYSGRANRGYQLGYHTLVTKLVNTLVTTAAPHFLRPVVSRASQLGRMSTGASAWVAAARLSSSHCYAFAGSLSAVSTTCRLVCPVLAVIRPRLAAAFGESKLTGHNGA